MPRLFFVQNEQSWAFFYTTVRFLLLVGAEPKMPILVSQMILVQIGMIDACSRSIIKENNAGIA